MYYCNFCDKLGKGKTICGKCQYAIYCDKKCQGAHYAEHKVLCDLDHNVWENDNLSVVQKADIVNSAYVDGRIFQSYMKTVLSTKTGRKRVLGKLKGRGERFRYLTSYTEDQKEEILEIVNSNPPKYDPTGELAEILNT